MPIADHLWALSPDDLILRAARAAQLRLRCLSWADRSSDRIRKRQLLTRAIRLIDVQLEATVLFCAKGHHEG